jgi:hypothetical protein
MRAMTFRRVRLFTTLSGRRFYRGPPPETSTSTSTATTAASEGGGSFWSRVGPGFTKGAKFGAAMIGLGIAAHYWTEMSTELKLAHMRADRLKREFNSETETSATLRAELDKYKKAEAEKIAAKAEIDGALQSAAEGNNAAAIKALLAAGADVNCKTTDGYQSGVTPLHTVLRYAKKYAEAKAAIDVLHDAGADWNAQTSGEYTPLDYLSRYCYADTSLHCEIARYVITKAGTKLRGEAADRALRYTMGSCGDLRDLLDTVLTQSRPTPAGIASVLASTLRHGSRFDLPLFTKLLNAVPSWNDVIFNDIYDALVRSRNGFGKTEFAALELLLSRRSPNGEILALRKGSVERLTSTKVDDEAAHVKALATVLQYQGHRGALPPA